MVIYICIGLETWSYYEICFQCVQYQQAFVWSLQCHFVMQILNRARCCSAVYTLRSGISSGKYSTILIWYFKVVYANIISCDILNILKRLKNKLVSNQRIRLHLSWDGIKTIHKCETLIRIYRDGLRVIMCVLHVLSMLCKYEIQCIATE